MKHFRLLFLTVVLSAVCATASAQRVTLDMQNAKLEKVLGQITQQTGLVFNYTRPTINPDKRVSVSVKQAELESVLRQLFDADGIVYEIKDGKVYLADRKGGVTPPRPYRRLDSGMPDASSMLRGIRWSARASSYGDRLRASAPISTAVLPSRPAKERC